MAHARHGGNERRVLAGTRALSEHRLQFLQALLNLLQIGDIRLNRLRLAPRLTVDGGVDTHADTRRHYDFDAITFVAGPQLWVRISPAAFFVARAGAGGSVFLLDLFNRPSLVVSPTVDGMLGFAFDLP